MSHKADDDSSLDTLLSKYGSSSKKCIKLAEPGESSTDDYEEQGNREEYPSQFLREIRERAQILSKNAAKTRKAALQSVVNDESHLARSTPADTSPDFFVDVIRSAAISDEMPTKSPLLQTKDAKIKDDDPTAFSSDDDLQPVIPLDTAPWTAEDEDTLNISHDYYQSLRIEPWGASTTDTCDDRDSEDSNSTSEESLDSNSDDIDGDDDENRASREKFGHLSLKTEACKESDLTSYLTTVTKWDDEKDEEDSTKLGQHLISEPPNAAQAFENSEMIDYQRREDSTSEDGNGDEDNDNEEQKESEEDGEKDEERFSEDAKDDFLDTKFSSDIPAEGCRGEVFPVSPEREWKEEESDRKDEMLGNDVLKVEMEGDPVRGMHPSDSLVPDVTEVQWIPDKTSSDTEDNDHCLGERQDVVYEIVAVEDEEEEERKGDEIGDKLTGCQSVSQLRDISWGSDGNYVKSDDDLLVRADEVKETEKEEETGTDDASSSQLSEATAAIKDTSFISYTGDTNLEMFAENQEKEMFAEKQEKEERMEIPSLLHPKSFSDSEQDASLDNNVSSALNEMHSQPLHMDRTFTEDRENNEDLLQTQNQELSSFTQQTFDESGSWRTVSSEQVVQNSQANLAEAPVCDEVRTVLKEQVQEADEVSDCSSAPPVSQDLSAEKGNDNDIEDERNTHADGPSLISHDYSWGESLQATNDSEEEVVQEPWEEKLEATCSKMKGKQALNNDSARKIEKGEVYLYHSGPELQASSDCLRQDEDMERSATFPANPAQSYPEPTKLETREFESPRNLQNQGENALCEFTTQSPKSETESTFQKQPVNFETNLPHGETEHVIFSSSQTVQQTPETLRESKKPENVHGLTKTGLRCGKRWNSESDTHNNSGTHVTHSSEHQSDLASAAETKLTNNSAGYTCRQRAVKRDLKSLVRSESFSGREDADRGDEDYKGPGNVRSLIARFNSRSANASPVESPSYEKRVFDWNISTPRDRRRERATSMDEQEKRPSQHQASKSSEERANEEVPWMRELMERRRRREQRTVWGKMIHQS